MIKDPLFRPFSIKHLTLRNRVMSASHEPALTENGMPTERYRLYHREKAKGGLGLTMIGGSAVVSRDSAGTFGNIDMATDAVIPHLQALADDVHDHGAAVMTQITHMGRRSSWYKNDWLPIVAASTVREMTHRTFPKIAEPEDIERIAQDYANGARRARDGGLDGVEVMGYSHFFASFLNDFENLRDDSFGGAFDNRMKFAFDVLERVRREVGDDFVIGIRLAVTQDKWDGYKRETGLKIIEAISKTGLVDFLSLVVGSGATSEGLSRLIPMMGDRDAPHLEAVAEARALTTLPIMHSSKMSDVASARHAIESGKIDLVGMTRAHFADPHIVNKIKAGREDRIRPCVGAGYCIDQIYSVGGAYCIHNPATGREKSVEHLIAPTTGPKKRITIVGAGVAGLEAARVCAERGHNVTLLEASSVAGGQVLIAARAPRKRDYKGIVDWLVQECNHAGVDIRYDVFADASEVDRHNPDIVIVATGALPNTSFLETGEDLALSTWDVLNGQTIPAGQVLLYDENGREAAVSCAEYLAKAGAYFQFVTPDRMIGPDLGSTNFPPTLRALKKAKVPIRTDTRLTALRRVGNKIAAAFYDDYTYDSWEEEFDTVVTDYGAIAFEDLYYELKPLSRNHGQMDIERFVSGEPQNISKNTKASFEMYRIGDAVAHRNIHAAMYEARRLCVVL